MAIKQLTEEQVREWTLEQKDQWWLDTVYRGDMRQLTLPSAGTGALLGSVLSLTNLYIGIKTGWTLGVGITSVILSFATFKLLSSLKLGDEMTVLENNAMQSIATSAGYMTSPLMASLPAYMMVTGKVVPMWHAYWWMVVLGLLGALFAFPLKKRYINDEQLPFPEGYAAGVVLDNLHSSGGKEGILKAKILGAGAFLAATIEFLRTESILAKLGMKFMALPSSWDGFIYKFFTPSIGGIAFKDLTIKLDSSIVMMGTGALMSIRATSSMLLGAVINYFILAPIMINKGIIVGPGFKNITMWALWGGAAMMTTASIYSFLASGNTFSSITELFKKKEKSKSKKQTKDILEHIELPKMVSYIGVPILGIIIMFMGKEFFDIDYWLAAVAIPLVFMFSIMAVKSTGVTAITPGGALGKMTQVTYSVLAPGNMGTNLISAGITSEVCLSASNLLMDIKPAYMLGGKPRHQAIGHAIGIFCGGLVAVPVFYMMFGGDISVFSTEQFPMPGATVWKAVAEVLSNGLNALHWTAQVAVLIGGVLGIIFEILGQKTKGKFPLSPVAFGIAFVLPFHISLEFFIGSAIFWLMSLKPKDKRSSKFETFLENKETIGAGIIAGGSIVGIALMIAETSM
ncbi:MAG: OPT/YSL family transporter [Bdellovibrionales bacterium]|nr:OPT/YSL family transporter [Bdellovibrionales bacterium]NQZ18748.1 OPT/YSL family transporter [Bdellovibrionales bacterium]